MVTEANKYPLWQFLSPESKARLAEFKKRHFNAPLVPPSAAEPGEVFNPEELESLEEIEHLMRRLPDYPMEFYRR